MSNENKAIENNKVNKANSVKAKFDLNRHTNHLLSDEPFWSALSREITKRESTQIPTAGVRLNPHTAQYELLYNPDFWMSLDAEPNDKTESARLGRKGDKTLLLIHEFSHCIFGHVTTRSPASGMTKAHNIAMDLAINGEMFASHKHKTGSGSLYDYGVCPGKKGEGPQGQFADYPVGLSYEAYYKMLQRDFPEMDKEGGEGSGVETFDDHGGFGEVDSETQIIADQRLKNALQNAAENAMKNGWGNTSASTKKAVFAILKSTVDWKKVLRYFVKTSQRSAKKSSIMRVNRRHPFVFPGSKSSRTAHLCVGVDMSGSVSDALLSTFFGELCGLSNIADFTVVPFDVSVDESKIFRWKKNQKVKVERVLQGGTCFDAITDHVNSKGYYDGVAILTDMGAPKPKKCCVQRIWITDEASSSQPYFSTDERVLVIPNEKE